MTLCLNVCYTVIVKTHLTPAGLIFFKCHKVHLDIAPLPYQLRLYLTLQSFPVTVSVGWWDYLNQTVREHVLIQAPRYDGAAAVRSPLSSLQSAENWVLRSADKSWRVQARRSMRCRWLHAGAKRTPCRNRFHLRHTDRWQNRGVSLR